MAQRLKLDVIAEGVETEVQLAALRAGGCHQAQGVSVLQATVSGRAHAGAARATTQEPIAGR
ncbi:MAG TPA: hypothetical protein VML57_09985 [Burkholderiales bacterium]|nr:hypothetical protein [Burkholderiales bacterium]